ncbi:hypothetical protein HanIR_Chr15g0785771 [Helianthus annuus]|nr:hypothetical protein HanIR_Chr15g0785771 [Helianthus annuus]
MVSECTTVESRCATVICVVCTPLVPFLLIDSNALTTALSDSASSALVASSRSMIAGLFNRLRAIAILCFCPPES